MDERSTHPAQPAEATRRGFFQIAIGVLAGVGGLVLGIPLVGSLIGPAFRKKTARWSRVVMVSSLPVGQPVVLSFADPSSDAYLRETVVRNVWAVRRSAAEVTVFSPICTHLGCRYDWEPNSGRFLCPCHGSLFTLDGKVLAGPAPRPLDTLPVKIENGELFVEWERFEPGIPKKIPV
ncbi:MAG: ubiquinol-cytochrome c reductase iron-sulfur subunit [Candidatus Deferrimicrobiaceae bacterium]